ncbi:MAG TPA: S8 family serine peptidase [Blastocatellia bacterium]|nr:S8 family serine peptidase [Blastocatellia bacterium]
MKKRSASSDNDSSAVKEVLETKKANALGETDQVDAEAALPAQPQAAPNLTPFQPSGWSDKIVVSKTPGGHIDGGPFNPTDTLFVDWAELNNGDAAVPVLFRTKLFVDGIEKGTWNTNPPLGANFFAFVDDFSIGSLSAGNHTLRIVVDVFNEVAESNEFDNEYTKFITVTLPGQPNLTPFQPTNWSDRIVVSDTAGTHTDGSSLNPTDTLFVDFAVINNGTAPASNLFRVRLLVDGIEKGIFVSNPPLDINFFAFVDDFSIGSLSAGSHTLKIVVDIFNEIAESNEFDNEYTKFINVVPAGQPNLTPFQPSGWSDKIVVSKVTGSHIDSGSFSPTDTLFIDWAAINNGLVATPVVFHTRLFVDGIEKGIWNSPPPLGVNFFAFVEDFSIGSLSAGNHTLRIVVDVLNEVTESNEFDNEYTKFITVSVPGQPNLTPFQPNGWSDKIVVSNVTGTHSDSGSFSPTDTLFVDWAVINNGSVATSVIFRTRLFVDGVEKGNWFTNPSLPTNSFTFSEDFSIGSLSAGSHTLRIVADVFNELAESNEFDNEYTKTINVSAQQCFTLTLNASPNDGGTFGKSPQNCSGALNVDEPDIVPQSLSEMPAGVGSLSGLKRTDALSQTFRTLMSKAEASGSVQVIVGLRSSFQPEGTLSNIQAVQTQRSVIAQAQDRLLNQMPAFDAESLRRYETIPFLAMEVDVASLAYLENSPDVISIQENVAAPPLLADSTALIGAPNAWASGFSGAGQVVAILDTGVDKNHPFLAGKVVSEACFSTTSGTRATSVCPGGVSESTSSGSGVNCPLADCAHGTHVAGIAAGRGANFSGVARDANIIAIQVFTRFNNNSDCDGQAPCVKSLTGDILKALERVIALSSVHKIAAVNMSLGGGKFTSTCDSTEIATKQMIDNLRSLGIATVIASGNESFTDGLSSPACISSAISVGSTGDGSDGIARDTVSSFSNSASFLNLLAPGQWITSSVPGGGFDTIAGTSMSAPHVAGAWAILKSKSPTASVDQVLSALTSTGLPITDGRNGIVKPRIRVDAAVNALGSGGGGGGVSQYRSGSTVTLTANPNSGFTFVKWQRDGVDFSTGATVSVLMGSDHTMTAVFQTTGSAAPTINSITFDGKKNLRIEGGSFGLSPRVMINNVDRSKFIKSIANLSISLKAKRKKLGLNDGDNTVQVIDANGVRSNVALLRL